MNPRAIILILAAVLTVGGTIYMARSWIASERASIEAKAKPAKKEPTTYVLVAKQPLPAGMLVTPEHLRWQSWPDAGLLPVYVVQGKGSMDPFVGAVVRRGVAAGEPLTDERVVKPGDRGFLAAVLTPGMRAVTVSVTATSGIGGLVFPGDKVDLILALKLDADQKDQVKSRFASETILTGVRVLAVDQKTDDQSSKAALAKTVTLEVTPKQAEVVAVAGEAGSLLLSLRSLQGDETEKQQAVGVLLTTGSDKDDKAPERGGSFTWDIEASAFLDSIQKRAVTKTEPVVIVRGEKAKQTNVPSLPAGTTIQATVPAVAGAVEAN